MFKNILVALALLCFVAAPAAAFTEGPTANVLWTSNLVEIDVDGDCISVFSDGDALGDTCSVDIVTELTFPTDVLITKFGTVLYLAGDAASYECDFQLMVGGSTKGTKLEQDTATVVGTANMSVRQDVLVPAGVELEVVVTDGGSGCTGTIDPKYTVILFGYPVN
jgi:hypothetical protein